MREKDEVFDIYRCHQCRDLPVKWFVTVPSIASRMVLLIFFKYLYQALDRDSSTPLTIDAMHACLCNAAYMLATKSE